MKFSRSTKARKRKNWKFNTWTQIVCVVRAWSTVIYAAVVQDHVHDVISVFVNLGSAQGSDVTVPTKADVQSVVNRLLCCSSRRRTTTTIGWAIKEGVAKFYSKQKLLKVHWMTSLLIRHCSYSRPSPTAKSIAAEHFHGTINSRWGRSNISRLRTLRTRERAYFLISWGKRLSSSLLHDLMLSSGWLSMKNGLR